MSLSAPVLARTPRLRLSSVATPDSPLVAQFYAGFDRAFVLPNEKETLEGIKQCLALNAGGEGARLAASWGRAREYVAVAEHRGSMVGGANFIVFATEPKGEEVALLPLARDRLIAAGVARARGAGPEHASLRAFLRDAPALA